MKEANLKSLDKWFSKDSRTSSTFSLTQFEEFNKQALNQPPGIKRLFQKVSISNWLPRAQRKPGPWLTSLTFSHALAKTDSVVNTIVAEEAVLLKNPRFESQSNSLSVSWKNITTLNKSMKTSKANVFFSFQSKSPV